MGFLILCAILLVVVVLGFIFFALEVLNDRLVVIFELLKKFLK